MCLRGGHTIKEFEIGKEETDAIGEFEVGEGAESDGTP